MAVRGPGIPAGRVSEQMALNIDLAPTFADLGGATTPSFVDGGSLKRTFAQNPPSWRAAFLVEYLRGQHGLPWHDTVRTVSGEKYVEYPSGAEVEQEYYRLARDPHELENAYRSAGADRIEELHEPWTRSRIARGPAATRWRDLSMRPTSRRSLSVRKLSSDRAARVI